MRINGCRVSPIGGYIYRSQVQTDFVFDIFGSFVWIEVRRRFMCTFRLGLSRRAARRARWNHGGRDYAFIHRCAECKKFHVFSVRYPIEVTHILKGLMQEATQSTWEN
jgi:hypothetical protein